MEMTFQTAQLSAAGLLEVVDHGWSATGYYSSVKFQLRLQSKKALTDRRIDWNELILAD